MHRHNDLHTSMFEQSIHTGVVMACFDAFCQTMTKKTVVVVDNASIHRSEAFEDRMPHWKKHGLMASITASATLYPSIYPTSRRGGLRGAGGISTDAKIAVNMQRGFCLKNRSAAVVPSGRVRKKLSCYFDHDNFHVINRIMLF